MGLTETVRVKRIQSVDERSDALKVLKAIYHEEKNWVDDEERMFAIEDLEDTNISWFVCYNDHQAVGVLRILYEPPLELYRAYGFKTIGEGLDIESFLKNNRIAEIGRFAVLPEFRRYLFFASALMRAASEETVERGFSHYVTDVFEGEKHSPYDFHTRVMGFIPVATHDAGELNCPNRRITMILDLKKAYQKLKRSKQRVYRMLTDGWSKHLHQLMES